MPAKKLKQKQPKTPTQVWIHNRVWQTLLQQGRLNLYNEVYEYCQDKGGDEVNENIADYLADVDEKLEKKANKKKKKDEALEKNAKKSKFF